MRTGKHPDLTPQRAEKAKPVLSAQKLRVNSSRILLREAAYVLNLEANINEQSAGMVWRYELVENTAQISHAFLVKLVTQLMTHGAAGFLHKTETVRNIARLARNVLGTQAVFRAEWHCLQGSSQLPQTWSPSQPEPNGYSASYRNISWACAWPVQGRPLERQPGGQEGHPSLDSPPVECSDSWLERFYLFKGQVSG